MEFCIGGHLSIAGKQLADLYQKAGGGPDITFAWGGRNWPVLFGATGGWDSWGGYTESFSYGGVRDEYTLSRDAFWFLGMVRISPFKGRFRPHLDLLGGAWLHDMPLSVDTKDGSARLRSVKSQTLGAWGATLGVQAIVTESLMLDLQAMHLRAGGLEFPDIESFTLIDDELWYDEKTIKRTNQWTILLQLGWHFDG